MNDNVLCGPKQPMRSAISAGLSFTIRKGELPDRGSSSAVRRRSTRTLDGASIHAEQGRAHNPRQYSPLCLPIPVG